MSRKLLAALGLTAGALLWAPTAKANLIGLSASPGTMTFDKLATGGLSFTTSGFTFAAGAANWQVPTGNIVFTGSAALGALSGTTSAINASGIFPIITQVPATESFNFTGGGNTLNGTITWTGGPGIKDGTSTPQFDVGAFVDVTSCACSGTFLADFPVGSQAGIDFTLNLPAGTTLTGLATGASTTGTFSSGEDVPGTPLGVPEPASLTLLGSVLLGFGLLRRRRTSA
jgi:hypothetical protein